jgi:hypothetical protein
VVLLPAIPHGYDPHHMDFPGAVTIGWDTFTRYCADVGRSLAHHGFRRMLFLNGHGSNQNLVEMAARLVMVERPEVLAAAAFYLASPEAATVIERVRASSRGGMAHACELETSIYLAIDPDAVDMELAVDERGYPEGEHAWLDWSDGSLKLMPWWSAFSRGVVYCCGCFSEYLRSLVPISPVAVSQPRNSMRTCVRSRRRLWSPHPPGPKSAPACASAPPTRRCCFRPAGTSAAWLAGTWQDGASWGEARTGEQVASGRSPQRAAAAGPVPSPAPPTTSGPAPTRTCRPSAPACGGPSTGCGSASRPR